MSSQESFNRSALSKLLNSPAGRVFRLVAGIAFLVVGYLHREHAIGIASLVWGLRPVTAGLFDICYISAALGGPLSGPRIRREFQQAAG